jgi:terminase small subunit-like protein
MGRPSIYDEGLGEAICDALADGMSLNEICKVEGMPNRRTVQRWADSDAVFAAKCERAREAHADHVNDRMASIENDVLSGVTPPDAARVAISSMQWRASKMAPKRYGDKLDTSGTQTFDVADRIIARWKENLARLNAEEAADEPRLLEAETIKDEP